MEKTTIVLFTHSFPFKSGSEYPFLVHEIKYLVMNYHRVIIVPEHIGGEKFEIEKDVEIDTSFSKFINNSKSIKFTRRVKGTFSKLIIKELLNRPTIFINPKKINRLISYIYTIKLKKKWLLSQDLYKINNRVVAYTYWFTSTTSALLDIKNKNYFVISRIHGTDLYEERHDNYLPLRKYSIAKIDKIYCVSLAGKNYLTKKYNDYRNKYEVARLGTKNPSDFNILKKKGKCFRIVSCSSLIPLKRVELILEGVYKFSKREKNTRIEWVHFGSGPLLEDLKKISEVLKTDFLKMDFKGHVENSQIIDFYDSRNISVFITTSRTEGLPVSIMEAASFGIPIIGTDVGGISEIINVNNGILLRSSPSIEEVSDALWKIYHMDLDKYENMRASSREIWAKQFNADDNFKEFANGTSRLLI